MMKSKIFMCQNPGFCKKKSAVFDGFINCIHDCSHASIIQMHTDMDSDGYRYRYKYRWIQIQIDRDTDTDGYRYNINGYRWINCLISYGTPDLMGG